MAIDLRLPKLNAPTTEGQVSQLQSYLYQLVSDLNWALNTVQDAAQGNTTNVEISSSSAKEMSETDAVNTFNTLKALIIKSADIVEAYQEKMQLTFDGIYTAQSDFGNYTEATNQQLTLQSNMIEQTYTQVEIIDEQLRNTNAYIRTGEIESGVFGIEVGQTQGDPGSETFSRFARFTADGIYFFIPGVNEAIAWMTGTKLYITNAQVTGSLQLGGYVIEVDSAGGIAFKWGGL